MSAVTIRQLGVIDLSSEGAPYIYRRYMGDNECEGLDQMTVYAVSEVEVLVWLPQSLQWEEVAAILPGDAVHLTDTDLVRVVGDAFVVGVPGVADDVRSYRIVRANEHYRVVKPWGEELWIAGQEHPYCLKDISINAGHQTSLQYHEFKHETNVVYFGVATLVTKKTDVPNDAALSEDLQHTNVSAFGVIDVPPGTLHRIVANTDITLIEASTPHLDDVIRVQDDAHRGNGRVDSEHNL